MSNNKFDNRSTTGIPQELSSPWMTSTVAATVRPIYTSDEPGGAE